MKLSGELKAKLEALEAKDGELCKSMVFDANPTNDSETHDKLWHKYWENFGRENNEEMQRLKRAIRKERQREIEVGDGVTECLWSDRHAGTVIKRTKTTLTMQYDKATLKPTFKPEFVAGGFGGHCINSEEQEYTYERDENGGIVVFHWSEKFGGWRRGSDQSVRLKRGRHEYYDYNF